MNPSLALLLFALGVAGLFYLDRKDGKGVTRALWLPTFWLLIVGSRAPSFWLGIGPSHPTPQQLMEGSPFDAAIFGLLLVLAFAVVWRRREQVRPILKLAWPILLYFAYAGLSVLWSAYVGVSFKRWVKSWGDLAMVLIIATEPDISAALRRLFSRVGFVLMPASVLLIKYYPALGRSFDAWTGAPENIGVSVQKNGLGVIAFVLALGTVWHVLGLLRNKDAPNRRRHMLAQLALLTFAIWVLWLSHSDTSLSAFALGAFFLLLTAMPAMKRPAVIHALVLFVLLGGSATLWMGGEASVAHAMGRQPTLSGRTDIWKGVLQVAAEHPVLGAGFESFWTGQNLYRVWRHLPVGENVNESHDGYIEVLAQLGWVGVMLIALLLVNAYRLAVGAFRRSPALGGLLVGYVVALVIYNITEAGFRLMDPSWIFLLFAFVAAAQIVTAPAGGADAPALTAEPPVVMLGERWRGAV